MAAVINPAQTEAPTRAALYFRVSTGRQAEADLSIPDQRRQALAYCAARGWDVAIEFVEPGMSGTDDRRPELQRLLDMASAGGAPFDVVLVHSFGRFARDHFALELHVRRLRKAGVRLVSITQDLGEDPMSVMVRQVFALFDEYQSKENAKHNFLGFSYGFRPGRGTHDALDALCVGIDHTKVNWILDADIRSFFDEVGQEWAIRFLKHRIGDLRIIRLIQKWLKAGVLEDGVVTVSDKGTGQRPPIQTPSSPSAAGSA